MLIDSTNQMIYVSNEKHRRPNIDFHRNTTEPMPFQNNKIEINLHDANRHQLRFADNKNTVQQTDLPRSIKSIQNQFHDTIGKFHVDVTRRVMVHMQQIKPRKLEPYPSTKIQNLNLIQRPKSRNNPSNTERAIHQPMQREEP